jgi:hypothetical protein
LEVTYVLNLEKNSTGELDEDSGLFNPTIFRNKLTFDLETLSHPE